MTAGHGQTRTAALMPTLLGEPLVNVLAVNIELDNQYPLGKTNETQQMPTHLTE